MVDTQDRASILDFYERARNLDASNQHRIAVLALLCGQHLQFSSTIEDYLFGLLWFALQDREDPVSQIMEIGAKIRKYGPAHFAGEVETGAWGFSFPLLASQQFKTALLFLAENGGPKGLMQATHIALAFYVAGIEVSDLVEPSRNKSSVGDIVGILLTKYAQLLEKDASSGVLAALQYLLRIPSKQDSFDEIASLISRSSVSQVSVLAGELDVTFERANSELDKYLPRKDTSVILDKSADILQVQAFNDTSKAQMCAKLLMLASSHTKLAYLLCRLISPPSVTNDDKLYWARESEAFFDSYLSKRSVVLDSLERDGKLELVSTVRSLLDLRRFFDLRRDGKCEEAFNFLVGTRLLPLRQEELDERQSKFKDLDPILKEAFPDVIVTSVECLFDMHQRTKSDSRVVSVEAESRLRELGQCARIIFIFSGMINMPSTCKNSVSQMRANMI
jgi:hypothetical protein